MFNKATLIGRVGKDPEIINLKDGKKGAKFSLATSESWKDKNTGEWKDKTDWHNITIWNDGLAGYIERNINKGDVLFVEGKIEYREYEKDGQKRYATDIVLNGFGGTIKKMNGKGEGGGGSKKESKATEATYSSDLDDDIPF